MTPPILEMAVNSTLESVSALAQAVRAAADRAGCAADEQFALELATSEAGSNVVRHAYRGEAGHQVRVRLDIDETEMVLSVLDEGRPVPEDRRNPKSPADDPLAAGDLAEGGRGIFIIREIMDEVSFKRDGETNLLVMTRRRRKQGAEDAQALFRLRSTR